MTLTNLYTKNGRTFVTVGHNLMIRMACYPNVQPETLLSLGYKQVAEDEVEDPSLYTDGFEERDGVTYWIKYVEAPANEPEPEPEPEPEGE